MAQVGHNPKPVSEEERKMREQMLSTCFDVIDRNKNGVLEVDELKFVARAFNPQADTDEEVRTVISRITKGRSDTISREDWIKFLNELLQFMNKDAFEKHCQELLSTVKAAMN